MIPSNSHTFCLSYRKELILLSRVIGYVLHTWNLPQFFHNTFMHSPLNQKICMFCIANFFIFIAYWPNLWNYWILWHFMHYPSWGKILLDEKLEIFWLSIISCQVNLWWYFDKKIIKNLMLFSETDNINTLVLPHFYTFEYQRKNKPSNRWTVACYFICERISFSNCIQKFVVCLYSFIFVTPSSKW